MFGCIQLRVKPIYIAHIRRIKYNGQLDQRSKVKSRTLTQTEIRLLDAPIDGAREPQEKFG
jgi:hypothetical protein